MQRERMAGSWFLLLAAPFFLNDFGGIYLTNGLAWLANDYGSRLIPLGLCWWLARRGEPGFGGGHRGWLGTAPWLKLLGWTLLLGCVGTLMDKYGLRFWGSVLPDASLGGYPVEGAFLEWFDLTFGLVLVAVSEEVVFRAAAARFFAALPAPLFYLATSLLFGAAHWSGGFPLVVNASLIGFVFMLFYRNTGLLWPLIAAHFLVNFVDFSGLWPW
ncbi:MAG: CPBP family intramembrane metalloprotease [Proteobacteria bacterium]|nr:CPBP family intramembrane metalloprotease [Pseudomonadota bacterium]MBU1612596.1 CPBP family intramembrane metalloprotease [Pseudomonadota bacterium]